MLPKDVARYLEGWGYHPLAREDFGRSFLPNRIALAKDRGDSEREPKCTFASLCAVPRGRPIERVEDLLRLASWVEPALRQYQPPGQWLPAQNGKRFTSQGILLTEETYHPQVTPRQWRAYLLVARDGYIEHGQQAGFPLKGSLYYQFAPLVAWVQRFGAFVAELAGQLVPGPDYWVVLNMKNTEYASLCGLGDGWREPFDGPEGSHFQCLESHLQISCSLEAEKGPLNLARWFAERIANAFGEGEPRCFNHPAHPSSQKPGELPAGKIEFR